MTCLCKKSVCVRFFQLQKKEKKRNSWRGSSPGGASGWSWRFLRKDFTFVNIILWVWQNHLLQRRILSVFYLNSEPFGQTCLFFRAFWASTELKWASLWCNILTFNFNTSNGIEQSTLHLHYIYFYLWRSSKSFYAKSQRKFTKASLES